MSKLNRRTVTLKTLTTLLVSSLILNGNECQISDGDDQFQVYHQDIGRISGSSSSSPVAKQTIIRQIEPKASAIEEAPPFERTSSSARPSQQQSQQQQQPSRKPSRVTLAIRTHAPIQVSTVDEPTALVYPAFTQAQAGSSQHQQDPAPFIPIAAPGNFQPSFKSLEPAELNSQRSLSNSVSARQSALLAQVAAERQAASESLGSIEQPSLPGPSIAQLQSPPPFHSQQQQQQHSHQAAASSPSGFVNRPEEPIVAPSFDQVLNQGCPSKGIFSWENKDYCDRYYMCTNGTFTEEACPNGLAYSQMGAVYQHCAYNWNVDCKTKKTAEPLASAGCPWQFGIFPVSSAGRCSIDYFVCEWGVPETKRCSPEGLFYDDRIKGCQWADQLGCKSEALLNFKCPPEDEDNPYWPYPRYYHTKQDVIVCVNEQPRLVHCTEDQAVDPSSLACIDLRPKKNKKKL